MGDIVDRPIQAGDLVVTLKGCPKCDSGLGRIFRVLEIRPPRNGFFCCKACGSSPIYAGGLAAIRDYVADTATPVAWLKRIPPLDELQTFRQTDETTV